VNEPIDRTQARYTGKRALVTGTGSGIGRATALRLAAEGAAVACLDVRGHDETAAAIVADGGHAVAYACDVTDADAVDATVDTAHAALGGLEVVCNIAGIGQFYRTETLDPADFDRIIAVNLRGTFLVCRFAIPHLLAGGGGVIVNTTSISGIVGNPWNAAYAASKGGVLMLTKALAAEYRRRGIRVNGIAPGMVSTNLSAGFADFFAREDIDMSEFGRGAGAARAAEPEEIAAAFAFVASDEASYMSGSIVVLDGGSAA
jgi:NAD(P)-dependent dehydrogenase (short-subunit alcohol dehydrogenase family)